MINIVDINHLKNVYVNWLKLKWYTIILYTKITLKSDFYLHTITMLPCLTEMILWFSMWIYFHKHFVKYININQLNDKKFLFHSVLVRGIYFRSFIKLEIRRFNIKWDEIKLGHYCRIMDTFLSCPQWIAI